MTEFKDLSKQQYEPTVEVTKLTHIFEYGNFEKLQANKVKVSDFDSVTLIDYTDNDEAIFSCIKGVSTGMYKGKKGEEF